MARGIVARRIAATLAALSVVIGAAQLAGSATASAHSNSVTGTADCQADGTYNITWTVANDYQFGETISTSAYQPTGSTVHVTTPHLDKYGTGTVLQSGVPGTATSAGLTVTGVWDGDGFTTANSGSITLDGTCHPPTPPSHTATPPTATQGSCVGQTPTSGAIVIPTDAGVTYALDGVTKSAGTYTVTPGTHAVTASSTTLTLTGQTSFTFDISAAPLSCNIVVEPHAPAVTAAACAVGSGTPTAPTLVLATTNGILYTVSASAPYSPGESVAVTATSAKGHEFDKPAPAGWAFVNSSTETYAVTFAAVTCAATVAPQLPTLTKSVCGADGIPTAPAIALASTLGVTYSTDKPAPYTSGESVVVTATADSTHTFGSSAPTGWTYLDPAHETTTVTFDAAPSCSRAAAPTFSDNICKGQAPTGATYTIPQASGVDYYVGGAKTAPGTYPAVDGSSVTISAIAQPGYTLTGATTFSHTYPATPDCHTAVVAVAPSYDPGQCVAGHASTPTYTIASTLGVDYFLGSTRTKAGVYPASASQTIVITAHPQTGYVLSGITMFAYTFSPTDACGDTPVPVKAVVFLANRCVLGEQVPGTFTVPNQSGVDYYATVRIASNPASGGTQTLTAPGTYSAPPGSTVTLTVRARAGYVLVGQSTFSYTFPAKPVCVGAVIAAPVTFHNDACTASGTATGHASYAIPSTTGAVYYVNGKRESAGTYPVANGTIVTVIARGVSPYTLTGITEWTHNFPLLPACAGSGSNDQQPTGGGDLALNAQTASTPAYTGVPVALLLAGGVFALLLGVGLLLAAGTRKTRHLAS